MPHEGRFPALQPTRPPIITANERVLNVIELQEGFRFPKSYCDFACEYGYGLLCGLFIIYIPMAGGDSLVERNADLRSVILQGVEEDFIEYDPHGSPELVQRLIPFGISENGETLAWDPDDQTGPDEFRIYVLGTRFDGVTRAATDLYDFVEKCLDDRIRDMLGSGYDPLPPTFAPYDVPSEE